MSNGVTSGTVVLCPVKAYRYGLNGFAVLESGENCVCLKEEVLCAQDVCLHYQTVWQHGHKFIDITWFGISENSSWT